MKRIFLWMLALILLFSAFALADPTGITVSTQNFAPLNWTDVFKQIGYEAFRALGDSEQYGSSAILPVYSNDNTTIHIVFVNGTASIDTVYINNTGIPLKISTPLTLPQFLYFIAGYHNSTGYYVLIYDVNGLYNYIKVIGTVASKLYIHIGASLGQIAYVTFTNERQNLLFDTITRLLKDMRNQGGNISVWLVFEGSNEYTVAEGGNPIDLRYFKSYPIYTPYPYFLYIGKSPVTVNGYFDNSGLSHTFGPGAYVIKGINWFYANYSVPFASLGYTPTTSTTSSTSTSTNATLTVTVNPSMYTIQFLVNGAVVKQGTGSLSYQFPKNTTVTIQILNGNTQVYQQSYKLTQDTTLYFNFGNDNTIWNPAQTGNLTLQFFAVDPTTGYFKSPLTVDTVQVVGINNSVTKTASSVSQVTFTNIPFGHYQISAQKTGYNPVDVWVFFNQSQETFRIGLVPQGSNLNPLGYIGTGNYNGTNTNTWQSLTGQNPPAPTVSGNFYGFHFIVTDANGNPANAQVQVLAIKSINKVLWQDSATYPLAVVNVQNGSAYWYITEQDLNQALQYAGFWESFGGFKIVAGSNSMFVPAQFAYNRFYEMRIVLNQNIFGNGNIGVGYQGGLFGSTDIAQLIGMLMPLIVLSMIAGIIKEAVKKR